MGFSSSQRSDSQYSRIQRDSPSRKQRRKAFPNCRSRRIQQLGCIFTRHHSYQCSQRKSFFRVCAFQQHIFRTIVYSFQPIDEPTPPVPASHQANYNWNGSHGGRLTTNSCWIFYFVWIRSTRALIVQTQKEVMRHRR